METNKAKRYSTKETCMLLGVSKTTLWRYVRAGYIKCGYRRENKRPFFMGKEIDRFMNARL